MRVTLALGTAASEGSRTTTERRAPSWASNEPGLRRTQSSAPREKYLGRDTDLLITLLTNGSAHAFPNPGERSLKCSSGPAAREKLRRPGSEGPKRHRSRRNELRCGRGDLSRRVGAGGSS